MLTICEKYCLQVTDQFEHRNPGSCKEGGKGELAELTCSNACSKASP